MYRESIPWTKANWKLFDYGPALGVATPIHTQGAAKLCSIKSQQAFEKDLAENAPSKLPPNTILNMAR